VPFMCRQPHDRLRQRVTEGNGPKRFPQNHGQDETERYVRVCPESDSKSVATKERAGSSPAPGTPTHLVGAGLSAARHDVVGRLVDGFEEVERCGQTARELAVHRDDDGALGIGP
jgi:hypothetical protein